MSALTVTATPTAAELETIGGNLAAFNEADVGPAERTPLAVLIRNDAGTVVAGISGYTAWGWLYVQWLWVHESQRGQGAAVHAARPVGTQELAGREQDRRVGSGQDVGGLFGRVAGVQRDHRRAGMVDGQAGHRPVPGVG